MKVSGDSYTYTWGITPLEGYIPAWAQEGGIEAMTYSVGIEYVFVNGVAIVSDGEYTGELPGRALRGPAYQP